MTVTNRQAIVYSAFQDFTTRVGVQIKSEKQIKGVDDSYYFPPDKNKPVIILDVLDLKISIGSEGVFITHNEIVYTVYYSNDGLPRIFWEDKTAVTWYDIFRKYSEEFRSM